MSYGRSWQKRAYYWCPSRGRSLIASLYGLRQRRQRYGQEFWSALQELRRLEYAPNEVLQAYQFSRLKLFLDRASVEVKYYRSLFERCRFSQDRFAHTEQMSVLPVLDKETVRGLLSELVSCNLRAYAPRWVHTSGTTGKALQFPLSSFCFQREYAFRAQHYSWANVDLVKRVPKAFIAGHPVVNPTSRRPPFWTYDHGNNWLLFSSYHMSEANLPAYVEELEKFAPALIGGYPSSVSLLAAGYRRWGRRALNLKAVFTASETLLPPQRELIESSFGCKVFMWYGNTEMCGNIVECERGGFHGRIEHSFMEVIDENGQSAEEGRLVCTGFGNSAFPLIRYDTGDVVKLSSKDRCECGRGGLLFESVIGRVEDYVVTPDGRLVGRLDHLFKEANHVCEAQLVQSDPCELTIRVVPRPEYTHRDEQSIEAEARLRLGPCIRLRFEYGQALERTPAGKVRFVVSTLNRNQFINESSAIREVLVSTNQDS